MFINDTGAFSKFPCSKVASARVVVVPVIGSRGLGGKLPRPVMVNSRYLLHEYAHYFRYRIDCVTFTASWGEILLHLDNSGATLAPTNR